MLAKFVCFLMGVSVKSARVHWLFMGVGKEVRAGNYTQVEGTSMGLYTFLDKKCDNRKKFNNLVAAPCDEQGQRYDKLARSSHILPNYSRVNG